VVSVGFVISLWAGSSAISAFVDSITEAHDQTELRHPVRQRFYALGLYVVMLVGAIVSAPFLALGPRKVAEFIPDSWDNVLQFGYYPVLFLGLVVTVNLLYRVSLPEPLPSHRLLYGSVVAAVVFLIATSGLRVYLTWITSTGYTYGALATPIAFLLFAFFLGFAIMIGAELNAAVQEEWPAPTTHAKRVRWWLAAKAESLNTGSAETDGGADTNGGSAATHAERRTDAEPPADPAAPAPVVKDDAATS
jgi:membrane protein